MTDREKLLEILSVPIYMREGADPAEAVADFLLDNDVLLVVRCKDCKYSHNDPLLLCDALAAYVCAEWFCWNGKRRDEEDGKSKLD